MQIRMSAIRSVLFCIIAACSLSGCIGDELGPDESLPEQRGGRCESVADCPGVGTPCRRCADGSTVCPEVTCERGQCAFSFAGCPAPQPEQCGRGSCGKRCTLCAPDDPLCIETAVVKQCQPDGSCSPLRPLCDNSNPCAVTLCPPNSQCVVLESFPPRAQCVPIDACALVRCGAGTHCEDGVCLPDQPRVFCGGIAGFACPGAGDCSDDPSDDCDPTMGGADCGGLCSCNAIGLCIQGQHWDSSPAICDCVPDDAGGGPSCGDNRCGRGEFCCNRSCGICAPRGGACIQIACDASE